MSAPLTIGNDPSKIPLRAGTVGYGDEGEHAYDHGHRYGSSDRHRHSRAWGNDGPWCPDLSLCLAVGGLLSLGIVMLYSSSGIYAARLYHDTQYFLWRQLAWLALGAVAMWVGIKIPGHWWSRRPGWLFLGSVLLCAIVLIPGVGRMIGGARRWLGYAGFGFQPSEIAKVALVVMLAALLARRSDAVGVQRAMNRRMRIAVAVLMAQIPIGLVLIEPDLGTALVMEMLVVGMVFVGGLGWGALLGCGLVLFPVVYHFVIGTPFRLRRVLSYFDPWAYRSSSGYQVIEALIAIGSGGIWGVGLGHSKQKLFFLPESHTDFIFAILAEELGWIGVALLLAGYGVVVWRGMRLAFGAPHSFDRFLALGLTALLGFPALFNVGVVTGLLPAKGLPLPFISYGGSHLVMSMLVLGMLLRIDRDKWRQRGRDDTEGVV